jgi:hypothetical protein
MKKNFPKILILFVLVIIIFTGCSLLSYSTQVRFQNSMSDFNFFYGLKFGDAEYIGSLSMGEVTTYLSTAPGDYTVQAKSNAGEWITISSGSLTAEIGHKYTIALLGSAAYSYFQIIQDE